MITQVHNPRSLNSEIVHTHTHTPTYALVVHSFRVNYRNVQGACMYGGEGKRNRLFETFRQNFPQNRFNLDVCVVLRTQTIIQTNVADETEKPSPCDVYYVHTCMYKYSIHVKYLTIHVGREKFKL